MAAYDLEEQEQISQLKAWWEENGKKTVALVVIVLGGVIGWSGWKNYQYKQASEASALYGAVMKAGGSGDAQQAREAAGRILQGYDGTAYAYLGALVSSKVQAESTEPKNAETQLQWVIAHAPEASVRDIARLRLAAVQLDQGDKAAALATLSSEPVAELAAGFADLRGDILVADGKIDEGREAYQKAIDALAVNPSSNQLREIIRVKLESIGGGK
ncbi:MAG: tetratricopeptide repeat protein [Rhodocyclaceae bacterium]|nr:tetratricopeptide repeat protein [Rhodocyclaceae bacterium]